MKWLKTEGLISIYSKIPNSSFLIARQREKWQFGGQSQIARQKEHYFFFHRR